MFSAFNLHERLLKALQTLGFNEPTPVQAAAIPLALQGRDLRATAQTGSGKTAAFLLPMLHRFIQESRPRTATRALILLPTRELAQQTQKQVEQLAQFTFIKSALVTGGEDFKRQAAAMRKNPEILIGTPGRLLEHLRAGHLELQDLEVLVLDEADRMLDMGFTDEVMQLVDICNADRQTLLFSATSGGKALERMANTVMREPQYLGINKTSELNEKTRQQIITADSVAHKEQLLSWLLAHEQYDKAIVFTNTREQADRLGGVMTALAQAQATAAAATGDNDNDDSGDNNSDDNNNGRAFKCYVLHGEKDQKDRKQALSRLQQGHIQVLIATDVAARGLDIAGMDLVVNFDMPRTGDIYVHRIGRTGRAGGEGTAISLVLDYEWNLMSSIERYLKQRFEQRMIKGLKGHYQGPKKLKASGKAAGSKKKKQAKKADKASGKKTPASRPAIGKTTAGKTATGKPSTGKNVTGKSAENRSMAKKTGDNASPAAAVKRPFGSDGGSRDGSAPLRRKTPAKPANPA